MCPFNMKDRPPTSVLEDLWEEAEVYLTQVGLGASDAYQSCQIHHIFTKELDARQ
jgi:hypothetical protein